jgi:hypothetical protein
VSGAAEGYRPLAEVARELGVRPSKLRDMARKGEFPPVLRIIRGHEFVDRAAYEAWLSRRWIKPEPTTELRPEFLEADHEADANAAMRSRRAQRARAREGTS